VALEYLYQGRKKEELMEINPCVENGPSYSKTNYVFMRFPVLKLLLTPTEKIHAGTKRFFSSSSAKEDVVDVGTTRLNRLLPGGFDE
jgi:hypothetical protein